MILEVLMVEESIDSLKVIVMSPDIETLVAPLEGEDAADIVSLFKGMAVFAEDQIVPVAILSVLWVSLDPKKHKTLSAMKVRQWVSQLLSRSILLGSASDGVSVSSAFETCRHPALMM